MEWAREELHLQLHMKRQYLLWLHLQMEHYENKQIFINDKYKGSCAQKDTPCIPMLLQYECVSARMSVLVYISWSMDQQTDKKEFQFERRGWEIGRMEKPQARHPERGERPAWFGRGLQLGHVNCHSSQEQQQWQWQRQQQQQR